MGKGGERQADGQLLQMMSVRKVGEWTEEEDDGWELNESDRGFRDVH